MPTAFDASEVGTVAETPFSLLRMIGGWGNVSGPGLLMLRSMVAGTTAAAVFGLGASMISATLFGTASPAFIVGSSLGFALGSVRWYSVASMEALLMLDRYPSLLRLHILANFPWRPDLRMRPIEWYTAERFKSNWQLRSILVASWLSAQPALESIQSRREAAMIDLYADGDGQAGVSEQQTVIGATVGREEKEEILGLSATAAADID